MILRHSIHQNSIHALPPADSIRETGKRQGNHDDNFVIPSKYSYQMVAIVHESGGCDIHVPLLERLGYRTMIRPSPINVSAITTNDWYRDNVRHENCCGDAEFIKLYAYQLVEYPIVVHWDLDVLVLTPMDDLFDAMLKDAHSPEGRLARQQLQLQPPQGRQQLPDRIDAFFTRDVTSAKPWEKVRAIQGGFVVVRPNASHFSLYQKFITEANYSRGRGPDSGWGGMGYGGFQGAMAYQGVISFFYDQIYPGHAVELDVCRWNQVTADVIWRGPDSPEMMGQCRQYPVNGNFTSNTPELGQCEDCRVVPVEETRTVHYTACNKPWDCRLPHPRVFRDTAQTYRLKELTNITTCGLLFRKYFNVRNDLEIRISSSMNLVPIVPRGDLHPEYFRGYCKSGKYIALQETLPVDFHMQRIYGF